VSARRFRAHGQNAYTVTLVVEGGAKMMTSKTDAQSYRDTWNEIYANRDDNPFDVEDPYEWIVQLEVGGRIRGTVLDAGCSGGHNALYLAEKGHEVVGIDITEPAISRAIEKAARATAAQRDLQGYGCLHAVGI